MVDFTVRYGVIQKADVIDEIFSVEFFRFILCLVGDLATLVELIDDLGIFIVQEFVASNYVRI